jgi:hypothetical protein
MDCLSDHDDVYSVVDAMSEDGDGDVMEQFEAWLRSKQQEAVVTCHHHHSPHPPVHAQPPPFRMSAFGMRRWRGDGLVEDVHVLMRAFPDRKAALGAVTTRAELHALLQEWVKDGDPEAHKWWVSECAAQQLRAMPPLRASARA